jgi:hypothetical protein
MECSYGTYTFGPSAYTSNFSVRPNADPAGRTVVSATYAITVSETVSFDDNATAEAYCANAVAVLSRNGDKLKYKGRGLDDLEVNVGGGKGSKRDVNYGPWTREIKGVVTGGGITVQLEWTVEFTIVNCPDGLSKGVLSFVFTVGFDIDREGYTTRRYESTLTIAATRKTVRDRTIESVADEFRDDTVPPPIPGFRRESQSFRTDLSKRELRTTVVDVQMPGNLPPVGVVDGSIEHSWQSQGLAKWTASLSATYDIARREGTAISAISHFLTLIKDRVAVAENMVVGAGLPGAVAGRGGRVKVLPVQASASEPNVLGRLQVRLGCSYMVSGVGFSEVLRAGGLWVPTEKRNDPVGNWKTWSASIPTVMGPRGHANLAFTAKEDALVDLCLSGQTQTPQPPPGSFVGNIRDLIGASLLANAGAALAAALAAAFPKPALAESWIAYRNFVTLRADTGRVIGNTLPSSPIGAVKGTGQWDVMAQPKPPNQQGGNVPFPPLGGLIGGQQSGTANGTTFVHQRSKPTLYVTMSGVALRAHYQIPMPELVTVNGKAPTLVGEPWFHQGLIGETLTPINRAEWSMTYAFTTDGGDPTGGIPVPPNPLFA